MSTNPLLGVQDKTLGVTLTVEGGKEADMELACGNWSSHGPDSIDDLSDSALMLYMVSEFQAMPNHS